MPFRSFSLELIPLSVCCLINITTRVVTKHGTISEYLKKLKIVFVVVFIVQGSVLCLLVSFIFYILYLYLSNH